MQEIATFAKKRCSICKNLCYLCKKTFATFAKKTFATFAKKTLHKNFADIRRFSHKNCVRLLLDTLQLLQLSEIAAFAKKPLQTFGDCKKTFATFATFCNICKRLCKIRRLQHLQETLQLSVAKNLVVPGHELHRGGMRPKPRCVCARVNLKPCLEDAAFCFRSLRQGLKKGSKIQHSEEFPNHA